jgi:argininosuccinate lyase
MVRKGRGSSPQKAGQAQAASAPAEKRWGGRFAKQTNPLVEAYTSSTRQDEALLPFDILGSIAHATMLGAREIIDSRDTRKIVEGLNAIAQDAANGTFVLRDDLEDVHMNVEAELERRIGPAAGRLHTARSRNDQVVTDFRMLVRNLAQEIVALLADLQTVLVEMAEDHLDTIMPGYTHMQLAQPVLLAHHLMAYFEMFRRDLWRFYEVADQANESALGSGALAGLPYPLDREATARALGFERISNNSMDAVSNRDFVIEFHSAAAICMMHISRLSEELIIWSTREFGFVVFDDAFATGSSIMPQKKNPDVAELARGRTGNVYGNLISALTLMKGLPLTYNRDLQEDKAPLFETAETIVATLQVFAQMLPTLTWKKERLRQAAGAGYSLATDIADYLVRKKMPFREAHAVVGKLVKYAESHGKEFGELTLAEYRQFSDIFDEQVLAIDLESAVNGRDVPGGTARNRVLQQIESAHDWLEEELLEYIEAFAGPAEVNAGDVDGADHGDTSPPPPVHRGRRPSAGSSRRG